MSNRNVEALAVICDEWMGTAVEGCPPGAAVVKMAAFLAGHGVLAVDSLTDEDCAVARDAARYYANLTSGPSMRAALRRLATGEAPNG